MKLSTEKKNVLARGLAFATLAAIGVTTLAASNIPAQSNTPELVKAATPVVYPVSAPALKKVIAAKKGNVILVNFWATWCPPCIKEFPGLVKLQKDYAKRGVTVLYVSGDEAGDRASKVVPFLKKQGITAPSYIIAGDVFKFIPQFDSKVKGAFGLPRTYVYNRSGKLVSVIAADKTYAEFAKIIKPLL